ncbi:MarR family transcriptional regulator [Vallitalea pronyensis]|uniref:MarR family transcriptional regulator n=1 Tax=Vallitalea pronyensis TaxID=1348613 RepID=A0A8J8SGN0_9FIRM|nr:MarR family transcriptional regulator [Vallitalea pronyensis]QUI22559.1 MarR family transcriptional regulator [Vallitalea pronyensis]
MRTFDVGKNIRLMSRNIKHFTSHLLQEYDLNEGQLEYFLMIYKHHGINQKELADIMYVSKASVTKAIKKLLTIGLIKRIKNEDDHRHYGLFVSEKGTELTKQFHDYEARLAQVMFKNISQEEIETLNSIITRMTENSKDLKSTF